MRLGGSLHHAAATLSLTCGRQNLPLFSVPAGGTSGLARKYPHIRSEDTSNLKSSDVAVDLIFVAMALPQKRFLRCTLRNRQRCTTFHV
jgi:hypothetical protein